MTGDSVPMTMTMESSGLVFKPPAGDPFPYQLPAASPAAPPCRPATAASSHSVQRATATPENKSFINDDVKFIHDYFTIIS